MVMPDNTPEKTTTHSEHTETVERNIPPVQLNIQGEQWWGAQTIDALVRASRSASLNNLLGLAGIFAIVMIIIMLYRMAPLAIEVLNTMNKHIPEQTKLMEQQNSTMVLIQQENARRNQMQQQGLDIQQSQTKQLNSVQALQEQALKNHEKIIENQQQIATGSKNVLDVLTKINTLLDKASNPPLLAPH